MTSGIHTILNGCLLLVLMCISSSAMLGQGTLVSKIVETYEFDELLDIVNGSSLDNQRTRLDYQLANLDFDLSIAQRKPNLFFQGRLPGYIRTSQETLQPDGTIKFQSIRYNNSSVQLFGSQGVTATGGSFRVVSDLQRFDDLGLNRKSYNGVPIRIGYNQPLFAFNRLKWQKQLSEMDKLVADKTYHAELAESAVVLSRLFFNMALAESDLERANQNKNNTDTLFSIAQERFDLGRLSKHDLLQLQLEKTNAIQSISVLQNNMASAAQLLNQFAGYTLADTFSISLPEELPNVIIDYEVALQEAMTNRPEPSQYLQALINAEREIEFQKKSGGLNANLDVSFGFARGAESLSEIYRDPPQEQGLSLSFSVPIYDFKRNRLSVDRAKASLSFTQKENAQLQKDFEANLKLLIYQYYQFKDALGAARMADQVASERYEIAQKRYVFGDINILDLSFSQREKDSARQNFINRLASAWTTYYQIQALTLFDFVQSKKILFKNEF